MTGKAMNINALLSHVIVRLYLEENRLFVVRKNEAEISMRVVGQGGS